MKLPKNIKLNKDEKGGITLLRRFFVRHGEKIGAGMIIIAALWLAVRAWEYQPLSWRPNELEELVDGTENAIQNSTLTTADKKINPFDYTGYAEQIKERIPTAPYSSDVAWSPVIHPGPQPRSGFEVLTAELLRGEAARRAGLNAQGDLPDQWQRPPLPGWQPVETEAAIWVNLYGTIPLWQQWEIYNQVFDNAPETNRPEYVYYELERAEINRGEELVWQPVIVYPDYSADDLEGMDHPAGGEQTNWDMPSSPSLFPDRLISLKPAGTAQEQYAHSSLLFSDFDIEPARTYAYRMRLYLVNPNYNLQETSVKAGVDTKNKFIPSDWSHYARVYVPDRTLVQIHSVTPSDPSEFPRQTTPLRMARGTVFLDYFDIELGQSLPLVEKNNLFRGMLCNMTKEEANRFINRGRNADEIVNINYPDTGLRSDVCILDFSGGRRLQKSRTSRESQGSPDLFVTSKALLLMPDGTIQITTTEPELFR